MALGRYQPEKNKTKVSATPHDDSGQGMWIKVHGVQSDAVTL